MTAMTSRATNLRWPGTKLSLLLGCLGLVAALRCEAQNLVPNPGFEETDSCTFGLGLGELHNWYSAYLTPDHLQSCLPYGVVNGLPLNIATYQQPYEGGACSGIITFDGHTGQEQREWLMVPLLDTLVPGQTYHCSFRANAAFAGNGWNPINWIASSNLGIVFTTYDRPWNWGDPYPATLNEAHILYPQILSDTVDWTLVSGNFVADSAYTYLMIGNFFSNALTDTLHLAPNVPEWGRFSYTLVDAVCVSPDPDGCERSQDMEELGAAVPFVYPNPASDVLKIGNATGRDAVVLDMLGKRVWSGSVQHDSFGLDVGSWVRGAYVLQVHGLGSVQVLKFVLAE
jgi:hypothetical protein